MANDNRVTSSRHCHGCFASADKNSLQLYYVQKASLQTILQTKHLNLCYICMKLAKNTERFIHNVQTAQKLLKTKTNFKNLNIRTVMKPLILTQSLLDQGDIYRPFIGLDENDEKVKLEFDIPGTENLDAAYTKQEKSDHIIDETLPEISDQIIDETLQSDDYVDSFMDNLENEINMKVENDNLIDNVESFTNNLECEFEVKIEDNKGLRKSPKLKRTKKKEQKNKKKSASTGKKKKRNEKNDNEFAAEVDSKIEIVYLTDKQLEEYIAQRRLDKRYLGCEYKCVDCIVGFSYKTNLEKHMEKYHSKIVGDYKCEFCKQRADSKDKLRTHIKKHYLRYKCTACNLTRVHKVCIVKHIAKVHLKGLLYYRCTKCEDTFEDRYTLLKHVNSSHKETDNSVEQKYICKYCNKHYNREASYKRHVRRKHPVELFGFEPAKKYHCKQCGKTCDTPSELKNHSAVHLNRRDHYCVECDKSYKTYGSLQHHLKTASVHIISEDMKLPCPLCKKRFNTKQQVNAHVQSIHKKQSKRFYCDQCGKGYLAKHPLAYHIQKKHMGIKKPPKLVCHVCKMGFQFKYHLNTHLRIHTGEKPFQCSLCPAQFNQYGSLYNHRKCVHKIIGKAKQEKLPEEKGKAGKPAEMDGDF